MVKCRVLTKEGLERGLQTFHMEDHSEGSVAFLAAIALHSLRVERDKVKALERKIENAALTLAEEVE